MRLLSACFGQRSGIKKHLAYFGVDMDSKNGKDYKQNYDFITKWMAAVLRGETPDFISADIGRIADVFAFEPTDIKVQAGRVDIMVRNTTGGLFHIEEQRNLRKTHMYRFAS